MALNSHKYQTEDIDDTTYVPEMESVPTLPYDSSAPRRTSRRTASRRSNSLAGSRGDISQAGTRIFSDDSRLARLDEELSAEDSDSGAPSEAKRKSHSETLDKDVLAEAHGSVCHGGLGDDPLSARFDVNLSTSEDSDSGVASPRRTDCSDPMRLKVGIKFRYLFLI